MFGLQVDFKKKIIIKNNRIALLKENRIMWFYTLERGVRATAFYVLSQVLKSSQVTELRVFYPR